MVFVIPAFIQLAETSHMARPDNGVQMCALPTVKLRRLVGTEIGNSNKIYHGNIFPFLVVLKTMVCFTMAGILESV